MFLNHITIKKPTTLSVAVQDAKEAECMPSFETTWIPIQLGKINTELDKSII